MKRATSIGSFVGLLALLAAAVWFTRPEWLSLFGGSKASSATTASRGDHPAKASDGALADPASAGDRSLSATREAEEAAASSSPEVVNLPPSGIVHFDVVDGRTLVPLNPVRIHFLQEHRFAAYDADSNVNVTLTSGKWEACVAAPGFEPLRLEPFEVKGGQTLDLGRVRLGRGHGSIEGRVLANHLAGDKPVIVELFGDGRAPCERCLVKMASPPTTEGEDDAKGFGADCHYLEDRDSATVTGGRTFRFDHLAAGVYWLRAFEPEQRIVEATRIEIAAGGYAWRDVDVTAPTTAQFELRHEGGGLFSGAWARVHRARPASLRYEVRRRGQAVGAVETTPSKDDTLASVGRPIPIPGRENGTAEAELASQTLVSWINGAVVQRDLSLSVFNGQQQLLRSLGDGRFEVVDPARLDRERADGDGLPFDTQEPGCDNVALQITAIRPDAYEIGPLPRAELAIVVTCGSYRSDEMVLDLRDGGFGPIVVSMKLKQEIADRMPEIRKGPPNSCIACHDSDAPTDAKTNYGGEQNGMVFTFSMGDGGGVEMSLGALQDAISERLLDAVQAQDAAKQQDGEKK